MPAPYNATGYTGKTYDPVAGLMDYSARWYSPTVGRSPGTMIDRYGGPSGNFASPKGTPFGASALPPESLQKPYLQYEVLKPVEFNSGKAAPWFGQLGMGTRYEFSKSIQQLLDEDVLGKVEK